MPVCLDTLFGKFVLKPKFNCFFEYQIVDRNSVVANNNSIRKVDSRRRHVPPSMFSDLLNIESFSGIGV